MAAESPVAQPAAGREFIEETPVICVDLDGTLILSDLAGELAIRLFRTSPQSIFYACKALLSGRARFKRALTECVSFDAALLPYRQDLLEWLQQQSAVGRRLVLATAADANAAARIADHLNIFDEVVASDGDLNLKGVNKGKLLHSRFGSKFTYVGDSSADLAVWKYAESAVLADVSRQVRSRLGHIRIEKEFHRKAWTLRDALKLMRVHQWAKNMLMFVPLVAAHRLGDVDLNLTVGAAVLAFGLWASSTYILNDLMDLEADRAHPSKQRRPLASGRMSLISGMVLMVGLAAAAMLVGFFVDPAMPVILALYLTLTLSYSMFFKRKLLSDVFVLAGLYCFRILVGGWIADIRISVWLLTFSFLFFLSLAFCKRSSELVNAGEKASAGTRAYGKVDLTMVQMLGVATSLGAVIEFSLYLTTGTVRTLYPNLEFLWILIPIALFWTSRVWLLSARGRMNDDPVLFAVKDKVTFILLCFSAVILLLATRAPAEYGAVLRRVLQWTQ